LLIRIITTIRFRCLKDVAALWLERYQKPLKASIADEASGDYKKLLIAVVERAVEGKYIEIDD
jgi:hypothetical protein